MTKQNWEFLTPPVKAPNFYLKSVRTGWVKDLSSFNNERLILSYLPGTWAPWCRKFLLELNSKIGKIQSSPISIELISIVSQNFDQLQSFVHNYDISIETLSDASGAIGKRFGIFDNNFVEPMKISKPSIFILDSEKYIRYKFIGKHLVDRPTIEEILELTNQRFKKHSKKNKHQILQKLFPQYV